MCRASRALLAFVVLTAALAPPLSGQLVSGMAQEERARIESELAEAEATLRELKAIRDHRSALSEGKRKRSFEVMLTERIGPFTVLARSDHMATTRWGVEMAWESHRRVFERLEGVPDMRIEVWPGEGSGYFEPGDVQRIDPGREAARSRAAQMLRHLFPERMRTWSYFEGFEGSPNDYFVRLGLLRTTNPTGLACVFERKASACIDFLFLLDDGSIETNVAMLERWYPEARWSEFYNAVEHHSRVTLGVVAAECTAPGSDESWSEFGREACLSELARSRFISSFIPSGSDARASFMSFALQRARPDAISVAAAASTESSVADYLEAITDAPIEVLVLEWLETTEQHSEAGTRMPGPASLVWAGVMILASFGSTRWRLG